MTQEKMTIRQIGLAVAESFMGVDSLIGAIRREMPAAFKGDQGAVSWRDLSAVLASDSQGPQRIDLELGMCDAHDASYITGNRAGFQKHRNRTKLLGVQGAAELWGMPKAGRDAIDTKGDAYKAAQAEYRKILATFQSDAWNRIVKGVERSEAREAQAAKPETTTTPEEPTKKGAQEPKEPLTALHHTAFASFPKKLAKLREEGFMPDERVLLMARIVLDYQNNRPIAQVLVPSVKMTEADL